MLAWPGPAHGLKPGQGQQLITAVKRPWRQSNRHDALGQMLLTNQRLDKLKAARIDFIHRGLLSPSHAPLPKPMLMPDEEEDGGPIDEHVTGTVTLARTRRTSIICD